MRILKTDVPVDATWSDYPMGDIVHVGYQTFGFVSVWWLDSVSGQKLQKLPERRLRVYGTGHPIPRYDTRLSRTMSPQHVGTAVDIGARLVWHLMEDVLT
jgi:hypothetical protein